MTPSGLQFYNTLTRKKEPFDPLDNTHVRMYVCGPTVYDKPHLGNARSVVVYDVLYRLLRHFYGSNHVTYVRNITDVDDKINARARERSITIQQLTQEVTHQFHADMDALGCLRPNEEPKATEHIGEMIQMIQTLITKSNAYVADDGQHVLFDVTAYANYGQLSGRKTQDQQAGARVAVENYKHHPGDFVLWKPADADDDSSSVFDSPWGKGRPGWHIECSVMSTKFLGTNFDIHGGGADLMFPHHENEIAQSRCAYPHSHFANTWVHNGFLTVNGEKMSKSLGNFVTVEDLLPHDMPAPEKARMSEIIRFALLSTHYRKPLDWNDKLIEDSTKVLNKFYEVKRASGDNDDSPPEGFMERLADDLNIPKALGWLHGASDQTVGIACLKFLGMLQLDSETWFSAKNTLNHAVEESDVLAQITARKTAKAAKNFAEADRIRDELHAQGVILEDKPGGITEWRRA